MQRTAILRGTVNKEYGKTIAEAINEKLDKNPEFELTDYGAGKLGCILHTLVRI